MPEENNESPREELEKSSGADLPENSPTVDPAGSPAGAPMSPPLPKPEASDAPIALGFSDKNWSMIAHLSSLICYTGVAVGGTVLAPLAPLGIWLALREKSGFLNDQAREAVNFNITYSIVSLAIGVLAFLTCGIGAFLLLPLAGAHIGVSIYAAIKSSAGEAYRYPAILRLVK